MRWYYLTAVSLAYLSMASSQITEDSLQFPTEESQECPDDFVSFEVVTGYVYTAPADMLDSQPGTLMLTDCIDTCRANSSCKSINYETGLCVLFSSSADENQGQLTPSQFPVFTIYVQKNCLPSALTCDAAWSFDRVMDHQLDTEIRARGQVESRQQCMELCLSEVDFECRSAMYTEETGECRLAEMDRHAMSGRPGFAPAPGVEYMEINCVADTSKLCLYEKTRGKILKTVDAVYQAIASEEDCRDLCNNAPFRCHSYDYNDTGDDVCRLSHHSAVTLTQVEEPYLFIEEATTFELSSCYNVSIDCHSSDMTATIRTTTLFDGKVYAKGSPVTCMEDIENTMEFTITMKYTDIECGVRREGLGGYINDVIIQHHDSIVTSADLGLELSCEYDLTNKSVSNQVDLQITGEISPTLYEESVVDSPNVEMRVADENGQDTKTAVVGDPLTMVWEILDLESPYEIFVRELVAMDGSTDTELLLIDERGCPTDASIMGEIYHRSDSDKISLSNFDAFRFPTSDVVQFRAMITPCLPKCEPVQCDVLDYTGQTKNVDSFGRKKRSAGNRTEVDLFGNQKRTKRAAAPEEMLVVQQLKIVDRYGKREEKKKELLAQQARDKFDLLEDSNGFVGQDISGLDLLEGECLDKSSMISGAVIFLAAQLVIVLLFAVIWRRNQRANSNKGMGMLEGSVASSRADSLSYMYESGFARRLQ